MCRNTEISIVKDVLFLKSLAKFGTDWQNLKNGQTILKKLSKLTTKLVMLAYIKVDIWTSEYGIE